MGEEMNCNYICELLTAYLDGEVTPQETADIKSHLAGCPRCHDELEELSGVRENLRSVLKSMADEVDTPAGSWERVRAKLDTRVHWFDGLYNLLGGRTWQLATAAAAVLIIIAVAALWQFGGVTQAPGSLPVPAPAPAPAPEFAPPAPAPQEKSPAPLMAPPMPFEVSVVPEDARYTVGQLVEFELSITNMSSDSIRLERYPPEIVIKPQYRDEIVFSVAGGTVPLEIKPGETVTWEFSWDQKDTGGNQVSPGWYDVTFKDIDAVDATENSYGLSPSARLLIE